MRHSVEQQRSIARKGKPFFEAQPQVESTRKRTGDFSSAARLCNCPCLDQTFLMPALSSVKQATTARQARRYKIIIVPDGNSVPDRLMSLLAEDVVVLKPQSTVEEYWYSELVPFRHYIPFKRDVSDLESIIERVLRNNTLLRHIARESTLFVLKRLNSRTISCYWVQLLREYSTLFPATQISNQYDNVTYYSSKEEFEQVAQDSSNLNTTRSFLAADLEPD